MKAKSKVFALLLALAMVFSMAMSAFAAPATPGAEPAESQPVESAEPTESESAQPEESPAGDEASSTEAELKGTIIVLHTNDVHGGIAGYAKVAALKKSYEEKGAYVLLVDAGDHIQGDPTVSVSQGATAVELMNLVGYDVSALGNHEFDYGYENLKKLSESAEYPIVAANVLYNGKVAFKDHVTFTTEDGVKIGVFGLDTPETATKAHPAKIKGVTFLAAKEMFDCAKKQVEALEADKCDYIICLGHLGIDDESAGNRSIDLLKEVTGIDLFIDGHSHSTLEAVKEATGGTGKVGDTYLTSTGTKLANVGRVILDGDTITIDSVSTEDIEASEDSDVAKRAKAIADEIEAEYGATFAASKVDLNGDRDPGNRTEETNLGDLITDAMVWLVTKDGGLEVDDDHVVAMTNGGGIRAPIAKGDISKNDVNTVLPFGNTVAVVYVTGEQLLEVLEASTYCTPTAVGGFPQIAGMSITVDTTKEFDQGELYPDTTYYAPASINRVSVESVNGKDFSLTDTYAVISNDFCAAGGDTYYAFSTATVVDTGVALDVALMQFITDELNGTISEAYAEPAGRITIKKPEVQPEPEPEPEPKPEPQPEGTYTVVPGDNLSKIARNHYGDSSKWRVIYEANRNLISNPNQIWPGQVLVIPAA